MDITFIIARFYPFLGGAEEYTFNLAKQALANGHTVRVLTTNVSPDKNVLKEEEIIDGIIVNRVNAWNSQLNLGFYPALLPKLWNLNTDIIHVTNGPGFFWRDFCLMFKRIKSFIFREKIKFITTPHGPFLSTVNTHRGIKLFVAKVAKWALMPYFWLVWRNLFDVFFQVNKQQMRWMQSDYLINPSKIGYTPNGISSEDIPKTFPNKPISKVGITFVARWEFYKGVLDLIKLGKALKDKGLTDKDFEIKIMGRPGPAEQEMYSLVKDLQVENVVKLLPSPSNEERNRILANESHIHILPSEFEATGIALLWAMAFGNTIITTTQNESWSELINVGENGEVFNYQDVEALTQIVYKLIKNPKLLSGYQQAAFDRRYNFTWEKTYEEYSKYLA